MANLKDIKKRIRSLKNTSQITKAMKMVSAAKLRRAQESIVAARPYAEKMQEVLVNLASVADPSANPLLEVRPATRVGVLLFTSDRGLCGGFNANLIKAAERLIAEKSKSSEIVYTFYGKKGGDYFKRRGKIARNIYPLAGSGAGYDRALEMSGDLIEAYVAGEIDEVHIVYGKFRSAISQIPTTEQILPIARDESAQLAGSVDVLYEPGADAILQKLLPKFVASQIYRAILETAASEHGARMSAMDSASKNAKEMIGKLSIKYNRARQAAITTELMDIINGAKAV